MSCPGKEVRNIVKALFLEGIALPESHRIDEIKAQAASYQLYPPSRAVRYGQ